MEKKERNGSVAKIAASVGGVLIAAFIAFFVWLAHLSSRVTVIEEIRISDTESAKRVEEANREAVNRIEHEREANDARVRDDLRELRNKVFQ